MHMGKQIYYGFTDTWTITKRYLLHMIRLPELLFFSSVQPIMFLLLFNYVLGGALGATTGVSGGYIAFLLPGILVQTIMFGCVQTGIGLSQDMGKGLTDRFRSLPMSRIAVIAGRTLADLLRNLWVIAIMLVIGMLIGFRF
ncbi:MAG TPA: ABC transporter permease, partial [Gammaproteobacteria bacterium]|nr:ABC transporter permease [Gammaproteobacteria bacterium]